MTGLTCAHLLLRGGARVTLFESSARCGGLASTFHREGFSFDLGPHEFCTRNPALLELLHEVCGEELLQVEKRTAQYFRGRYLRFPFEIADLLRNVGPRLLTRACLDFTASHLRNRLRPPRDESFEAWTRARFGDTLYELYFGPYTRKVWGIDPGLLDVSTASDRIAARSVGGLLRKTIAYQVFGREDHEHRHSELRRGFLYTRGGIGTLQRRLLQRFEGGGGRIRHGKHLVRLQVRAGRAHALEFSDGELAGGFDAVVSTIPLPLLLQAALGEEADSLLRSHPLPFRSLVFAFLRLDRPRASEYHWTYFPEPELPFQRITEFSHFDAGMAPEGRTGLAAELSCDSGDSTWSAPDGELAGSVTGALEELGWARSTEVLGCDIVRVRHAYPIQVRGFQERVRDLLRALEPIENLVTIGRQGLFRYCNMDECMEMALDVVPGLLGGKTSVRYLRRSSWQGVALGEAA